MATVRFTEKRISAWSRRWPCSTLEPGTAYFDDGTGDLFDITGKLSRANVDGWEFDAFVDAHQSDKLKAIRGMRAVVGPCRGFGPDGRR